MQSAYNQELHFFIGKAWFELSGRWALCMYRSQRAQLTTGGVKHETLRESLVRALQTVPKLSCRMASSSERSSTNIYYQQLPTRKV